jgi:ATP-binding cassette subfamily C protein LapB
VSTWTTAQSEAAHTLAAFSAILGQRHLPADLLAPGSPLLNDADPDFIACVQTLTQLGLEAQTSDAPLAQLSYPALIWLTTGQPLLITHLDAETAEILPPSATDGQAQAVKTAEIEPFYAGRAVLAHRSLTQAEAAHTSAVKPLHWFWGRFDSLRKPVIEIAIGSLTANLLALASALFALQVYDRVLPNQSEATLWALAIGVLLAIGLEGLLKIARARIIDQAGRMIDMELSQFLMQRVMNMRLDNRPLPPSGILGAMREFSSIREFFTASAISAVLDLPFVLLFLLLAFSIGGPIVLVLIVGGALMVAPSLLAQKQMTRLMQETQGANTRIGRTLHEALYQQETLRSQGGEERIERVWAELTGLLALKTGEQRHVGGTLTFWAQGVQQATYALSVVVGAYLVFAGEFTMGSIVAMGILTGRTLAPLAQLAATLSRWANVKTALTSLDMIAGSPQQKESDRTYLRRASLQGEYQLRSVQFTYGTDLPNTVDIDGMAILPGQVVAVLGSNGSGKSTFLKLLAGLYAPTGGQLMLDGAEMAQIDPSDIRRGVGYMPADIHLFTGSLRDNLVLGGVMPSDERLLEAADFAGLGPMIRGHAKGLDMPIGDGTGDLSTGQRQSIGWARLYLRNPQIVLLDEPTAAMDTMLEAALIKRVEKWLNGRTAIIATHRMPIVGLASRTMILQNGRLAVDGPKEEVMARLAQMKG